MRPAIDPVARLETLYAISRDSSHVNYPYAPSGVVIYESRTPDERREGEDAFLRVFSERLATPIGCSMARIAGPDVRDDLVAELTAKVWRSLDRFNWEGSLASWSWKIGTNAALNHVRKNCHSRLTGPLDGIEETLLTGVSPVPAVDLETKGELYRAVMEATRSVKPALASAFLLVDIHDLTYEEASRQLNIPVGTVKSRVNRARTALMQTLLHNDRATIEDALGTDAVSRLGSARRTRRRA